MPKNYYPHTTTQFSVLAPIMGMPPPKGVIEKKNEHAYVFLAVYLSHV